MKKIILGIALLSILFSLLFYFYNNENKIKSDKLVVVTTLFPLYDIAKNIGGDKIDVILLLPPGVESHAFEPKPSDILKINKADIFIYTGKFMEPWAQDVINGSVNKNLIIVDSSLNTKMIPVAFNGDDKKVRSLDPHIWLDFDNTKIMTSNISIAIQNKDSVNKDFYQQKTEDYLNKINDLDQSYKYSLSSCLSHDVIYAGHYAFGYLINRYGLNYLAAQGVSPDSEPTAKDLISLIDQIKKDNVKYIFYEELSSPKIAETIASETGAKMLMLNAAHNLSKNQFEQGMSFFDIMNSNLDNLKIGLNCK